MPPSASPRYAAVQYACLDPRTGILAIASAGGSNPDSKDAFAITTRHDAKGSSATEQGAVVTKVWQNSPPAAQNDGCCFLAHLGPIQLLPGAACRSTIFLMRALVSLLAVAAMVGGIYFYYVKKMPSTDSGTAPTQAISLTGVRMDLNQIAQAERTYFATNAKCASLDELSSSGTMNLARSERDGYTYEVRCGNGNEFSVIAHHVPAPVDSPIRYPILAVDQNMQIGEVQ